MRKIQAILIIVLELALPNHVKPNHISNEKHGNLYIPPTLVLFIHERWHISRSHRTKKYRVAVGLDRACSCRVRVATIYNQLDHNLIRGQS